MLIDYVHAIRHRVDGDRFGPCPTRMADTALVRPSIAVTESSAAVMAYTMWVRGFTTTPRGPLSVAPAAVVAAHAFAQTTANIPANQSLLPPGMPTKSLSHSLMPGSGYTEKRMNKLLLPLCVALSTLFLSGTALAATGQAKVVAFYSVDVEPDHSRFAQDALRFFAARAAQDGYEFVATTHWDDSNDAYLANYRVVIWLNDEPHTSAQEQAFERYMKRGGGWLGFHVAGYTEKKTAWPGINHSSAAFSRAIVGRPSQPIWW